jgi:hypothetical protein
MFYKRHLKYNGIIMDMTAVGSILVIIIVGVVYWVFSRMDNENADKYVDRHVRKAEVDAELTRAQAQADEVKMKREMIALKKAELLGPPPRQVDADPKILEDKSR